jgi:lycopene cyclase domain-containing protein
MAEMPDRYQYLALMAGCLLLTLPLEVVIGARVWRQPRRLLLALVPTVAVFTAWDLVAIARAQWGFVDRYVTGWDLPGDLPVEEIVFFIVIPICGLLTLEAVRTLLGDTARPRPRVLPPTDDAAARA